MNREVDKFLSSAKQWKEEMTKLRSIILATKLDENFKWRQPCYSFEESNIVIIQPFKGCLGLMFFKGTLLKDVKKILVDNGPNSQAAKRLEFRSVDEVTKHASIIKAYIKEAVVLEKSGQKIEFKKTPTAVPKELKAMFNKEPKFKMAFGSLTPGRQRAYILHFASAKQAETRQTRIEKCIPKIMKGKGLTD